MAINIKGGQQNVCIAVQTIPIASTGINVATTLTVYLIDAVQLAYQPAKTLNGITQFVAGKGYIVHQKPGGDLDIPQLAPPFPAGTGNGIILEDGTGPILPE